MDLLFLIFPWLSIFLGVVVAIEALALLIGMNSSNQNQAQKVSLEKITEWSTFKNNSLAILNVITGGLLMLWPFLCPQLHTSP